MAMNAPGVGNSSSKPSGSIGSLFSSNGLRNLTQPLNTKSQFGSGPGLNASHMQSQSVRQLPGQVAAGVAAAQGNTQQAMALSPMSYMSSQPGSVMGQLQKASEHAHVIKAMYGAVTRSLPSVLS